mgnify:CR=1 FL=1
MTKSELMLRLAELVAAQKGTQLVAKDVEHSVKVLVDTMTPVYYKHLTLPSIRHG